MCLNREEMARTYISLKSSDVELLEMAERNSSATLWPGTPGNGSRGRSCERHHRPRYP